MEKKKGETETELRKNRNYRKSRNFHLKNLEQSRIFTKKEKEMIK